MGVHIRQYQRIEYSDFDIASCCMNIGQKLCSILKLNPYSCSSGQCFASCFLQIPPHDDALTLSCILPTAVRIEVFRPLERAPAGHTKRSCPTNETASKTIMRHQVANKVCRSFNQSASLQGSTGSPLLR